MTLPAPGSERLEPPAGAFSRPRRAAVQGFAELGPRVAVAILAAQERVRPIAMTTIATILALAPLALAIGEGAALLQPLAVAIIAGLLIQMPLVLVFLPALLKLTSAKPR